MSQQQLQDEERRRQEECRCTVITPLHELCAACTDRAWHGAYVARKNDHGDRPQVYEGNGWQYGVADRPGYSDTPKDSNK